MTLAEQISEVQLAYHRLQIGESAASFTDQNGERMEYTRVSAPAAGRIHFRLAAAGGRTEPVHHRPLCFFERTDLK